MIPKKTLIDSGLMMLAAVRLWQTGYSGEGEGEGE
jgi:hypothetical protein